MIADTRQSMRAMFVESDLTPLFFFVFIFIFGFVAGKTLSLGKKRPADAMAIFAVASALIGLHCALDEFAELLALGRAVAECISSCPGIARVSAYTGSWRKVIG